MILDTVSVYFRGQVQVRARPRCRTGTTQADREKNGALGQSCRTYQFVSTLVPFSVSAFPFHPRGVEPGGEVVERLSGNRDVRRL